jgi:flavorubredoxin
MTVREIVPEIYWVGAVDWDRRLFDALIPLPNGTSYNSYVIKGSEKTVLLDTVDPSKEFEFVCNLVKLGIEKIDYIVVHHAEQDHSGTLPMVLELFPGAQILCSEKCRDLLVKMLEIDPDRCRIVNDRETITLGDKTLEFIMAPWVHWPETMLSYVKEDRILFSCDLFGSHYASGDLFVSDEKAIYIAAKRYYAEIMMPFRSTIRGHMEIVGALDIGIIAPSHGPLHNTPAVILQAYRDWISDDVKNEVVICYASMHGSTQKMAEYLAGALADRGITATMYNIVVTDTGDLAMGLVDAATIVIGSPTVLFGPHPKIVYATYVANLIRPKARFASVIGSFGWGGKTVDTITGMLTHIKPELLKPVYHAGTPGTQTLHDLDRLADEIAQKHREAGLLS